MDIDILAQNTNLYYIFLFMAALVVAVDFSGGCIKNTLSSAISRRKYFISKSLFITLLCLVFFFLNTYVMYFANLVFNGSAMTSSLGTVTKITLRQLPVVLALASVLTSLAFITKKTSVFNTITIPLILVFQLLLNLSIALFDIPEKYIKYELQIMITNLAYSPSRSYVVHSWLLCGILLVVCYVSGWLSFRNAEIK